MRRSVRVNIGRAVAVVIDGSSGSGKAGLRVPSSGEIGAGRRMRSFTTAGSMTGGGLQPKPVLSTEVDPDVPNPSPPTSSTPSRHLPVTTSEYPPLFQSESAPKITSTSAVGPRPVFNDVPLYEIHCVDTLKAVEHARAILLSEPRLGLDTETRPTYGPPAPPNLDTQRPSPLTHSLNPVTHAIFPTRALIDDGRRQLEPHIVQLATATHGVFIFSTLPDYEQLYQPQRSLLQLRTLQLLDEILTEP